MFLKRIVYLYLIRFFYTPDFYIPMILFLLMYNYYSLHLNCRNHYMDILYPFLIDVYGILEYVHNNYMDIEKMERAYYHFYV